MAPVVTCPVTSSRYLQTEGIGLVEKDQLAHSPCLEQWGLWSMKKHNLMEGGARPFITGTGQQLEVPKWCREGLSDFKHLQLGYEENVGVWPHQQGILENQDKMWGTWHVMVCLGFYWGSVEIIILSLLGSGYTSCNGLFATLKF